MKYIIDIPDNKCDTDLKIESYQESDKATIRKNTINEICNRLAANEYYCGNTLKTAFYNMIDKHKEDLIRCWDRQEEHKKIKTAAYKEVWDFISKIEGGDMTFADFLECFFDNNNEEDEILYKKYSTYEEARDRYKEWMRQHKIKIGDELVSIYDNKTIIVTYIDNTGFIDGINPTGILYKHQNPAHWKKTNRSFPEVNKLLEKLQGTMYDEDITKDEREMAEAATEIVSRK